MLLSSINRGQVSLLNFFSLPAMRFFRPVKYEFSNIIFIALTAIIYFFFGYSILAQNTFDLQLPAEKCFRLVKNNFSDLTIASDNEIGIISTSDGKISSFELRNGNKIWESELGGEIIALPLLDDVDKKHIYVATKRFVSDSNSRQAEATEGILEQKTSALRSISVLTGLMIWQISINPADKIFLYNFKEKIVFVAENGDAACVNKADGRIIWKTSFGSSLTADPFFYGDTLTVALPDKIVSVSMINAEAFFQIKIQLPATSLFVSGNRLYWGDERGIIYGYAFNKEKKKKLWKFQNGGEISYIIFTSAGLLVTSFDNFAYMLTPGTGKRLWKRRLPGRITIKPLVAGELAAITTIGSSELEVLSLRNGQTVNRFILEEKNLLLDSPLLSGRFLIFPTLNGVYAFTNGAESGKCGELAVKNRP